MKTKIFSIPVLLAMVLALSALLLAGFTYWSSLQQADRFSVRLKQLTADNRVQLKPAVKDAKEISRSALDVPSPIQRTEPKTVRVDLETVELDGMLAKGTTYRYWTFNGTVPGPMLRVREGDWVELHLKNAADSKNAHNIDLHAVNGPGGGSKVTLVAPGKEKAFRFKAMNPGLYIYHCAAPHIPTHIAMGMYGLILVEPPGGLPPVDKEFYIVQSEIYTNSLPGDEGHAIFSANSLRNEEPNYVVFNGQFQALTEARAMQVDVGDRVRLFVGNAGPNLVSSFHVIGEIFDRVHAEGATEALSNIQSTVIPAGGSAWVEFTVDAPGEYLLVDHSISRAIDKGAIGAIFAEGQNNPDVFHSLNPDEGSAEERDSGYEYESEASP